MNRPYVFRIMTNSENINLFPQFLQKLNFFLSLNICFFPFGFKWAIVSPNYMMMTQVSPVHYLLQKQPLCCLKEHPYTVFLISSEIFWLSRT